MSTTAAAHLTPVADAYEPQPLLKGKVVVLSGVGPGLGRALGEEAAKMGADLVLVSRTQKRLEKMAEVVRAHGSRALVVPTDITDEDSPQGAGRQDAGGVRPCRLPAQQRLRHSADGPDQPLKIEDLRAANETNVFAPLRLTSLFADALAATHGSVIMLNSAVQFSSQPEYAGYKLSKGALAHLAHSLATELGPRGIRVNSVAPSYIYEDVNKGYFDWLASEAGVTHDDVYAEKADPCDLKRLASPEEVARATLFLATDLASAVTGQTLTVDCGEFHS